MTAYAYYFINWLKFDLYSYITTIICVSIKVFLLKQTRISGIKYIYMRVVMSYCKKYY